MNLMVEGQWVEGESLPSVRRNRVGVICIYFVLRIGSKLEMKFTSNTILVYHDKLGSFSHWFTKSMQQSPTDYRESIPLVLSRRPDPLIPCSIA